MSVVKTVKPRTAPPPVPAAVRALMAQRAHRMHHYLWHEVRNGWLSYDAPTQAAIRALGWEPPRPAQRAGQPILDNDSGEDFLYMHRQMIASVNQTLAQIGEADYPKVQGWPALPQPHDGDYPPPPLWDSGDASLNKFLKNVKSDGFFTRTLAPWEKQYTDPAWLKGRSLGELGSRLEFTIHNMMHMRWCSQPAAIRPDVDPTKPDSIDPKWDAVSYDWLGDTYSSHVNSVFWKVHGWVDDRIDGWKRANNVTGDIPWKGTWVGKLPPQATPSSLHAILTGAQMMPAMPSMPGMADHEAEMKQVLQLVLKSGVRCRFYDPITLPD